MLAAFILLAAEVMASPEVRVDWSAPAGCPTAAQVDAQVRGYLGRQPAEGLDGNAPGEGHPVHAKVHVTQKAGKFRAQIDTRLQEVRGERSLEGDSCEGVASATALIVAMMIDPEAVRGVVAGPAAHDSGARTDAAPTSVVQARAEGAVVPRPVAKRRWLVVPSVVAGAGALPGLGWGGSVMVVVAAASWNVGLAGRLWDSQVARLDLDAEAGGRFSRASVGPRVWRPLSTSRPIETVVGAGIDVTRLSARGFGVSDPAQDAAWGVEPVVGAGLQARLAARLFFRVDAETAFPLVRPRFTLVDRGGVWKPPVVLGTISCGVALQF